MCQGEWVLVGQKGRPGLFAEWCLLISAGGFHDAEAHLARPAERGKAVAPDAGVKVCAAEV